MAKTRVSEDHTKRRTVDHRPRKDSDGLGRYRGVSLLDFMDSYIHEVDIFVKNKDLDGTP